ncbi:thioredoxin family protein [Puniceicoccaceae bacterium K14]|nr:thioredoxin family protein [Puniceicoccaceae bacterium K14]
MNSTTDQKIATREEWLIARKKHLENEKKFTRLRDELSQERRELPWVEVSESYTFETDNGSQTLVELFEGKSQLIVYHFMFGPGWGEGCKSCSCIADGFESAIKHLGGRDTTLVSVSRAPLSELKPFKERMGWNFKWVSSCESEFNKDFNVHFDPEVVEKGTTEYNYGQNPYPVEDAHGISVFARGEDGKVYHTYSSFARGLDMMFSVYNYLDIVPKGRDEKDLSFTMEWMRHHDKYEG